MCPRPIRSILVATDLRPASDDVVRTAARVAAATGAELHLLHACESAVVPCADPLYGTVLTFTGQVEGARRALDAQAERTLPAGIVPASREVVVFAADRAIAECARGVDADLVVLGPRRGGGGLGDAVFATTAERVMRATGLPCLVAHGELSLPLRRVAVPVDLADPDGGGVETALHWSRALGAREPRHGAMEVEVRVLHLLPPGRADEPASQRVHARTEAAARGEGAARRVPAYTERLRGPSPAAEVMRFARMEGTELLVVSSPRRSLLRRTRSDALPALLQRTAPCPVLLVPPGRGDEGVREGAERVRRGETEPLAAAV